MHVSYVAKQNYHRSDLDFPLWSAFQGACSSLASCTSVIRVLCQESEPTAFGVHPVFAAIAEDVVAAHSSATDGAWKLAWALQEVQPVPQTMIFVFSAFTLNPFSAIASFQVKSLLTHSSSDSVMITRSLAKKSSQETPVRILRDKALSTMMKSSGLSTELW